MFWKPFSIYQFFEFAFGFSNLFTNFNIKTAHVADIHAFNSMIHLLNLAFSLLLSYAFEITTHCTQDLNFSVSDSKNSKMTNLIVKHYKYNEMKTYVSITEFTNTYHLKYNRISSFAVWQRYKSKSTNHVYINTDIYDCFFPTIFGIVWFFKLLYITKYHICISVFTLFLSF